MQARDTMVALAEFFFTESHLEIGVSMLKRASWNGLLSNPKGPLDRVIREQLMRMLAGSLARHLQGSFCFHNLIKSLRVPVLSLAGEHLSSAHNSLSDILLTYIILLTFRCA